MDLYNDLYGDRLPPEELEQVLLNYFSKAGQVSLTEVIYGSGSKDEYCVKLVYEDNELTQIITGPAWKEAQLAELQAKIRSELLLPAKTKIGRAVLFYPIPVRGWHRYRDNFQVLPVPPNAPQPSWLVGDHPFQLEFAFPASGNDMVNWQRLSRRTNELVLLLNIVLVYGVKVFGESVRHHWVIEPSDGPWKSEFRQQGYVYEGYSAQGDAFLSTVGVPAVSAMDDVAYYKQEGISVGQELSIPQSFDRICDIFFSLQQSHRSKFLRAAFWYQHAQTVSYYSKSAAFIAFISAVEALMPPPQGQGRCPTCNLTIGPGPTKRFADFVEQLVPNAGIDEASRKHFYAIRSKLAHGGALLHGDKGVSTVLVPAATGDFANLRVVRLITRFVLLEWLFRHDETINTATQNAPAF